MSYISYQQFKDNGGKADESTFNYLVVDAESKVDLFTQNRLPKLTKLPNEIIPLMTRMINIMKSSDIESDSNVTSYSNGIESFGYGSSNGLSREQILDKRLFQLTCQFLGKYNLTYRGKLDGKYIQ